MSSSSNNRYRDSEENGIIFNETMNVPEEILNTFENLDYTLRNQQKLFRRRTHLKMSHLLVMTNDGFEYVEIYTAIHMWSNPFIDWLIPLLLASPFHSLFFI